MPMFSKGIVLSQHKEPAFSKPILRFVHPQTDSLKLDLKGVAVQSEQEAIIELARLARIVDERDGKLLYRKLRKSQGKAKIVIADAVDDEPYVSSRIGPLLHMGEEVADGLDLCCTVAGCQEKSIMVYKMITDLETRIPRTIQKIKVMRVRGGYPAFQQRRLSHLGDMPRLVVGVGALIHLARAVYQQKQQSTVFLTVAGNCVACPMNLEVSLGMTVTQVLERCGLIEQPTRIVCGGSMTGVSILDTENTLVTHTTRAILALRENQRDAHYNCIGCGRCEQVCPSGLNPMYIHRFVQTNYYGGLPLFDPQLCIGCGTCSYICPSKLEVATSVATAKAYMLGDSSDAQGEEDEAAPDSRHFSKAEKEKAAQPQSPQPKENPSTPEEAKPAQDDLLKDLPNAR